MMAFHHTTGGSFDPSPALLAVVLRVPLTIDFSCLFALMIGASYRPASVSDTFGSNYGVSLRHNI